MATREMNATGRESNVEFLEESNILDRAMTLNMLMFMERIALLPPEDQKDMVELIEEIPNAKTREDRESIVTAMQEILDQRPIRLQSIEPTTDQQPGQGLQKWMGYVSQKIQSLRKKEGLTQQELAEKSGLLQSHISRLEAGKHSPSHATLKRLATALGVPVADLDPSA